MADINSQANAGHPPYYAFFRALAAFFGGAWLGRKRVDPNKVTYAGAAFCLAAGAVWAAQVWWWPAFWVGLPVAAIGAWFDMIDGVVARVGNRATLYGANLDSVMDRVVEGGMFAALSFVVASQPNGCYAAAACTLALTGSFTVTYARAKAENLGLSGKAGWGGRGERLGLLGLVVLLSKLSTHGWLHVHFGYEYAAYAVGLLTIPTIAQRLRSAKRQLIANGTP